MNYILKTIQVKDNNVLDAICEIFDGEIDADWAGENEQEFWTREAQKLNKPDKDIVEEKLYSRKYANKYDVINDYIAEYTERYGNYYEVIDFRFAYDDLGDIVSLSMIFIRED